MADYQRKVLIIIIHLLVLAAIVDSVSIKIRVKRGYQTDPKYRWDPSQPIPYFFDSSLPSDYISVIRQGIALWQNSTCLNFLENANGNSAIRFFLGPYCYGDLGRQGKRTQDVSIAIGCNKLGTVMHEINHALGFFHTVSRPDRNESVIINYNNIKTKERYNFVENVPSADNSFNVPYDYGSVMQYEQRAAFSDIKQVNLAFQCGAKCPGKTCVNGGIANSRYCSKCLCPRGFGGDSCATVDKGDAPVCNGGVLTATAQPQTVVASVGTNDWVPYPVATNCYWMINAPAGSKVVFTLTAAPSSCVQNCVWQGAEVVLGNFDAAGVTMCCPSFIGQPFISTGNMIIVRGFARSNLANFSFQYSYV